MLQNYLTDLEEMRERNTEFKEYHQKLLSGVEDLKGDEKYLFTHAFIHTILALGFNNGKRAANKAMQASR